MLLLKAICLNGRPRAALLAFLFLYIRSSASRRKAGRCFDQRLPERADGGIDVVADKGLPGAGAPCRQSPPARWGDSAAFHELIAADAVSFAGEDFVQGVGGAADEGIPGLVAEAVVTVA